MSFADAPVQQFIDDLASGSPTPGGGSAAAVSGATAAALAEMVCNLTIGKDRYAAVEDEMREHRGQLAALRSHLLSLADDDAAAFDQVMAAFRMPKGDERSQAIQDASRHAAEIPMETAEHCLQVLEHAASIARQGNQNSVTDAGTAALLAHAGLHAALYNVRINLGGIDDEAFCSQMADRVEQLTEAAERRLQATRAAVDEAL
ncbi:MAG: cyclodeaminase/cyclohydrolase family protein [Thermoplasmatota archaeon]